MGLIKDFTSKGFEIEIHGYNHDGRLADSLKKIWERQKQTMTGPFFLQDHNNAVRYRNVWIRPLDEHAFFYDPKTE